MSSVERTGYHVAEVAIVRPVREDAKEIPSGAYPDHRPASSATLLHAETTDNGRAASIARAA